MIKSVLVLGAGSAGLLAAVALKRKIPALSVRLVRSGDLNTIGVGEGTTPHFPQHIFDYLGISPRHFYALAQPTWKLGTRMEWGPRTHFHYSYQLDAQSTTLPWQHGFLCDEDSNGVSLATALMEQGRVAHRRADGGPDFPEGFAFHIEHRKLVDALEPVARQLGVDFIDGEMRAAQFGAPGVTAIILRDGRALEADFFIDAAGSRSELLGQALQEPFISFDRSLFCDRAVVGGWERSDEPILPYTTAETMDAGWAWRIEHERIINRGYVYASSALSDDDARAEFFRKNPKVPEAARIVRFRSGRYRRGWVDNVVAVGDSSGFVEPLAAAALAVVCRQCQTLVAMLLESELSPGKTMRNLYNDLSAGTWEEIRDFLALHYRFNTRLDTPFWRRCREETDLSGLADFLAFYAQNGPIGELRHLLRYAGGGLFGWEGFLQVLVGNRVPCRSRTTTPEERSLRKDHYAPQVEAARRGLTAEEALASIRHASWRWPGENLGNLPGI